MYFKSQKNTLSVNNRISDYVFQYAELTPEQEAVVFGDNRLTYKMLANEINICSKALLSLGIGKCDRVAMLSTPNPTYYVVFLATVNIGAIWLGLNPKHSLEEYRHVISDARPKLLLAMAEFDERNYSNDITALVEEYDCLKTIVAIKSPINRAINYSNFLEKSTNISNDKLMEVRESVEKLDPAVIVYTSGTSGRPKGAVLSHYGLSFGATVQSKHFNISHPSIICNMPINHVACTADICCTTLVAGGRIHFQESFIPSKMMSTIESEGITIWAGVPTMFLLQMDLSDYNRYDLSSVQLILWGGSAMPEHGIEKLQKLNCRMKTLYGMTETSAHTVYSSEKATLEDLRDSIGFPDKLMPCRIVNEQGVNCASGEEGELQFIGDYLMLGYFNDSNATAEAFTDDGWFHTGDIACWRTDGSISIVGRMSEMYKSGGYNVYPREIELLLDSHPSVSLSAVVSVNDATFQEVGAAFVTLNDGQSVTKDQLTDLCKTSLANYKIPKQFHIIKEMPMLPVGKVDKAKLKLGIST